jgi:hypothetical protein
MMRDQFGVRVCTSRKLRLNNRRDGSIRAADS